MTELKSIQLFKAAKELNVGVHTAIEFLASKGHKVEEKPSTKLTPEQYDILLKAFSQDSEIKKKSDEITIGQTRKKEKEEAAHEVKASEPVAQVERVKAKVEGFKVVGQIDLDKKPAPAPEAKAPEPKPEPKREPVAEPAPVKEIIPEPVVEVAKPIEVPQPEPVVEKPAEVVAAPVVEVVEAPKVAETPVIVEEQPVVTAPVIAEAVKEVTAPEEPKDDVIRARSEKLAGPKIMGNIILPDKRIPDSKKPGNKEDEKKKRKRIEKKPLDVTKVATDQGGVGSTDRFPPRDRNRKGPGGPGAPGGGPGGRRDDRNAKPDEAPAVSGKEIDDKIKATLAKLSGGGRKGPSKPTKKPVRKQEAEDEGEKKIKVTEYIAVSELASIMNVSPTQIIAACFSLGVMVSINQRINAEVIELVAGEFGFDVEFINVTSDDENTVEEVADKPEQLKHRAPIVTIMGHVDHGKTSLLDYIRSANIVAGEAGGITQHIGAYEVTLPDSGKQITFLDTPGHEAFTAMRARGAQLTDIVVIVVAADDNVMPQTKEAISHAQAANVPMVIAINKIDKPDANPDNIRQQLSGMNILVEEWGGKYQCQEISAKKGVGVKDLLEKILLEAELLELTANPNKNAVGSVIEASLDKGRGYVSTIMVQEGTLEIGDFVVAGQYYGKVKAMTNERGGKVMKAGPSTPVQLLGLNGAPAAGDRFKVYSSEQDAKEIANKRATILREQGIRAQKHITLDEIGRRLALGNFKELKIIVKGDVDGSVEALSDSLLRLSTEEIQISIVLRGVGAITENDVNPGSCI
jgi:translation initiation factor IF-2